MKKFLPVIVAVILISSCKLSESAPNIAKKGLKVMIQVDFEGVTGVVNFDEIYPNHPHFERNSIILTKEINAAVEGAVAAGATEIVVRDGHAGNINVDPVILDRRAKLTRGRLPGTPHTMVLGIDSTYDALLFIGAHARAGVENGTLSHTMSLKVLDFRINGVPLFEAAYNSLYAGQFGVPVVFLAGDDAACREAVENFGNIDTVVTKYSYGRTCAMSKSPDVVYEEIRIAVERALRNIDKGTVFTMDKPYRMEVRVKTDELGGEKLVTATSDTLEVVMKKFWENL
ncbi:MAG: M55 family metallopeptidase [Bacteroidales bacterium]|jgi:D-amino peptidase|nr:M55 family metallopeptidase [Bacteroidales bacterium]MDZ4059013.1 M55 family metallopeptidase [Bacteroidales bacterium]